MKTRALSGTLQAALNMLYVKHVDNIISTELNEYGFWNGLQEKTSSL